MLVASWEGWYLTASSRGRWCQNHFSPPTSQLPSGDFSGYLLHQEFQLNNRLFSQRNFMVAHTPLIESFLKRGRSCRPLQLQHWLFDSFDQLARSHHMQQLAWSILLQAFLKHVEEPVVENRQGNGKEFTACPNTIARPWVKAIGAIDTV